MTKLRIIRSLRPVSPARPSLVEEDEVRTILERAAAGEVTLYFEIPAHLTAISGGFRKMANSLSDRHRLTSFRTHTDNSNAERAHVAGLSYINYPERRPNARYVGLTRESVDSLRIAGQTSAHWFHDTLEIVTANDGGTAGLHVCHSVDFVCLRPSISGVPRGPVIEALSDCTLKMTLAELLMPVETMSLTESPVVLSPDALRVRERAPGIAILHDAARAAYKAAEPPQAATMDQLVAERLIALKGDSKLFNKTVLPLAWKSINTQLNRKQGRKVAEHDRFKDCGGLDIPFVRRHLCEPHVSDSLAIATYIALRHSQRRIEGDLRLREQVALDLRKYGFAGKGERDALERIITWPQVHPERSMDPPLPQDFVYDREI